MKMPKVLKKIKKRLVSCRKYLKFLKNPHFVFITGSGIFFVLFIFLYIFKDLPSPRRLEDGLFPVSTLIFDREDRLLYEIYAEQNRTPIKLEEVPEHLIQATIAIEDKDFYRHKGLSLRGILRASYNIAFRKNLQGGSTITQQLVKTALLTPERTLRRKAREAILSFATELLYSKAQILEMYLNHVAYGGTSYGIEQASLYYFGKSAGELTLAESALLAGLPQAPTRFSPFGPNPKLAKERQKQVLSQMVSAGFLTEEDKKQAEAKELVFAPQKTDIRAPHFVLFVKELLVEKYGQKMVEQGGLRVKTSLDLEIQDHVQEVVTKQIEKLTYMKVSNGAALVTKPPTGEILAMVGSRDYFDKEIDGNVNLTTALRQPGSAIKPVNYATAFAGNLTPATMLIDMPTCFQVTGQPLYCPQNYDGKFHGAVQLRFALGNSYNLPAVKVLALNGVENMIETGKLMGITTWQDPANYGLSLTLGGGEVKITEVAVAFGVLANQGYKVGLQPILEVKDYKGNILEKYEPEDSEKEKVIPQEIAYLVSHILLDNNARTAAFGASSSLVIPGHAVSVKTGTTDDLRDNWTIGYTPSFLVATWVGNNDNSPMNPWLVSGTTGAAPIWNQIMRYVLHDQPDEWPEKPESVEGREVCNFVSKPKEGEEEEQIEAQCQNRFEYFIKGTGEQNLIERKEIWIDPTTGRPPEEGQTEGLHLEEHVVASDPFIKDYCVDCNHDNEKPRVINMDAFNPNLLNLSAEKVAP